MGLVEMAKALVDAIDSGDMEKAASYLSDDFVLVAQVDKPLGKDHWKRLQGAMIYAFPDWSYNLTDAQEEEDNSVRLTFQITGTHLHTMDFSEFGLPLVQPTGKAIKLPVEQTILVFKGDKVFTLRDVDTPGGGVPGIYQQLGVEIPPALQSATGSGNADRGG